MRWLSLVWGNWKTHRIWKEEWSSLSWTWYMTTIFKLFPNYKEINIERVWKKSRAPSNLLWKPQHRSITCDPCVTCPFLLPLFFSLPSPSSAKLESHHTCGFCIPILSVSSPSAVPVVHGLGCDIWWVWGERLCTCRPGCFGWSWLPGGSGRACT